MPDFLFWNEVVIPLAGMATGIIITFGVFRLVSRTLDRKHRDARSDGAVQELQHEVHQLRGELDALQERVDFAERLLTQQKEASRLGPAE